MDNMFTLRSDSIPTGAKETFESLVETNTVRIERIISCGQTTPEGEWYDQPHDEWVMLLQGTARLQFEDVADTSTLHAGEFLQIQRRRRHRVVFTSSDPPCIWLAVHYK